MSKVLAFLNNRPGAAAVAQADPNVPVVASCGGLRRSRTIHAHFPKALTPGFVVLGLQDLQRHAVEVTPVDQSKEASKTRAGAADGQEPAHQAVAHKLVLRDVERRGDVAVIAEFASFDDAKEALMALHTAVGKRVKKRWVAAGVAVFIFVVFFMPIPNGNNAQQPQRVSARSDYNSTPTQMLAMPPRTGGLAAAGLQPAIPTQGLTPQASAMPQGAFPTPMAPSTGAMPTPGVDMSSMPLPSPAILPNQAAQAPQQVPQAQVPAVQQPRPADDDPFGLKLVPGANLSKH